MAPAKDQATSKGKQKTLLGFFSKPNGANQPKPKQMPAASTLAMPKPLTSSSSLSSTYSDFDASSVTAAPTDPTDIEMLDDDEEVVILKRNPPKRKSFHGSSEDERVFESDTSEPERPKKRIAKKMRSTPVDDDDYESDLSDVDVHSDEPEPEKAPRPRSHSRSSSIQSYSYNSNDDPEESSYKSQPRPPTKRRASASNDRLTVAERKKIEKKQDTQQKEEAYSFLKDVRDKDHVRPGEAGYDPRTLYVPPKAWNSFTPFEKQFWEIKQNHFDTVLFFQKGKFFELYEEDARIGHSEFDLKLTQRVKMSMVGVPESSFDFWAAKFLARGYKVGRVDQSETALGAEMRVAASKNGNSAKGEDKKKIVRRELNKVLTVGTLVDARLLNDDHSNHCISIIEHPPSDGKGSSFGVTVLDAATSTISLAFWHDDVCLTNLETMIRQLRVKEVILSKGNLSPATNRVLKTTLSGSCLLTTLGEQDGYDKVDIEKEVCALFSTDETTAFQSSLPPDVIEVLERDATLLSLGNLAWYLKQLNIAKDILSMRNFKIYDPVKGSSGLALDGQSLAHIEVLVNSEGTEEGTLIQLLGRCITPFGKRLFRIWLCKPLSRVSEINDRLDAVEEFINHPTLEASLAELLKKVPDLERIVARIHAKDCNVKDFLRILTTLRKLNHGLHDLSSSVESFSSRLMKALVLSIPDLEEALSSVEEQFETPEDGKTANVLVPQEGKHEKYDEVRDEIQHLEGILDKKLKELERRLGASLSYWHSAQGTKEIYLVQTSPGNKNIPGNWKKSSSTKAVVRYDVPELAQYIRKLKEARENKKSAVTEFKYRLYEVFDSHRPVWLSFINVLAQLDCLMSLSKASVAIGQPACRPEIVNSEMASLEFEDLRHPSLLLKRDFIPNDVTLGTTTGGRIILLTGPNMGGKSTVMRMTAVGVIMAQLGMYVPASSAKLSPMDRIMTRMGAYDNMFAAASTFKVELDECCKILKNATPKSLVILDELGRGTSTFDGMAVAMGVLHYLTTRTAAISIFATHYSSLTDDFAYHPSIRNMHMSSILDDEKRELIFLYKLVGGSATSSFGTHVASLAGVAQSVVERAESISKDFAAKLHLRQTARNSSALPLVAQADFAFLCKIAVGQRLLEDNAGNRECLRTIRKALAHHLATQHINVKTTDSLVA